MVQKEHHGAIAFLIEADMVVWRRFALADFREVGRSLARQAPPVSDIQQHLSAAVLTYTYRTRTDKTVRRCTPAQQATSITASFTVFCATSMIMFALCSQGQLTVIPASISTIGPFCYK